MIVGIVGAGFVGMTAALDLQKRGHTVTLFESEYEVGGLAMGFRAESWNWSLEKHYHHIFKTDKHILDFAKKVGVNFDFKLPKTSMLVNDSILQIDSPLNLLKFNALSFQDRLRTGLVIAYLKYLSGWKGLEKYTAHDWLQAKMGKIPYGTLWEPLLIAKFGNFYKEISLAWFWARIKARTQELGYPEGGFQNLAETAMHKIKKNGGLLHLNSRVVEIGRTTDSCFIKTYNSTFKFDRIIVTVPNLTFASILKTAPASYLRKLRSFQGIGALTMILELDAPMLPQEVYWLSISQKEYPFLAVVEHTNFIDRKYYGGRHIVYIGNYLQSGHIFYRKNKDELLEIYHPFLNKLSPGYRNKLQKHHLFVAPFAQPVVTRNFSKNLMDFKSPIAGVYLANMQQVYPWDRGTNFAVELGNKIASMIS